MKNIEEIKDHIKNVFGQETIVGDPIQIHGRGGTLKVPIFCSLGSAQAILIVSFFKTDSMFKFGGTEQPAGLWEGLSARNKDV